MSQTLPVDRATNVALESDVVVVGLGPVGLMACILLGQRGYHVIGLERWPSPYGQPRAVTFDHEIARILSLIGIDADNDSAIDYHDDHYYWVNADDEVLLEVDWISKAQDGWRNRYWFSQPDLEDRLRAIIASLPTVELRPGHEVTAFGQDEDGVIVSFDEVEAQGTMTVKREGGRSGTVRAKFAIGSDGANSFIRRASGLEYTDLDFFSDWLVVDVTPNELPHYKTAHFQICDPARPTTVVPGGPGRRRWEFMALPGEDLEELGSPERVWELLEPFDLNAENAVLDRAVVWRFQAKYVQNWRAGRALLAGDAAHLMPPFAGEGMCAGLRDIVNLVWRLDLVLQGTADIELLDEWSNERREQAKWYINFSADLGRVICVADPAEAAERDERLKAEYAIQSLRGPVSSHEALLGAGTWVASDPLAGKPSIQGRVAFEGRTGRFDDAVGRGWFLLSASGSGSPLTDEQARAIETVGGRELAVGPLGTEADVIDLEGAYTDWMTKHGIRHLLVRPDFYVAATASTADELRERFDTVMRHVVGAASLAPEPVLGRV
ncbi:bifunctional 3-(3-hydroxy-phenyl)propionate/3-hydroxycinnamic acid hydroxylase MhpA [Agromyces bauzanensis]